MNLKETNLLIIESSFAKSKTGLFEQGKLIVKNGLAHQKNSDYLLEIIYDLIHPNYILGTQKLSAIVLSAGPGSFTAMRVGVSIAKALSFSFNLPIIPICSMQAVCQSAINQNTRKINQEMNQRKKIRITALMDARVQGIYLATFEIIKNSFDLNSYQLTVVNKPRLISFDELELCLDSLIASKSSNCLDFLAGNFEVVYASEMSKKLKTKINDSFQSKEVIHSPDIKSMLDLAIQTDTKNWLNCFNFEINYVRNQVANQPKK